MGDDLKSMFSSGSGDLTNLIAIVGLKFMSQFSDCHTTEFLFAIDNRLSDFTFTSGLAVNFGTQSATTAFYYVMSRYSTKDTFTTGQLE